MIALNIGGYTDIISYDLCEEIAKERKVKYIEGFQ